MLNNISALDSAPMSLTAKALNTNFNLEEKQRREQADKNKQYFYNNQKNDLILTTDDVDPIVLNLTRPILKKRSSMLYSRPLNREFEGPAASVSFLEGVYKENSIDTILQRVDLLSELTGSCLVHPLQDETFKFGVRLVTYDGSEFSAAGADDDPNTADAISLLRSRDTVVDYNADLGGAARPQVERQLEQQIWTTETVSLYSGSNAAPVLQTSATHGLGYLPFVNFKGEEVHDAYIGYPVATSVVEMNAQINQLLTNLGYMIKLQAFTPVAVSGFKSGESVVWHPGRILSLPANGGAQAIDLNPKIQETLEFINWMEDRIYVSSSVPKISVEGGEGESGRELLVRWFPLMQVFHEKTVRFARYELQLANLILALNNMPPIEDVIINWPEESIMPLAATDEDLDRDLRLNLTNILDEIIKRNPGMDEAEAMSKYKDNKNLNGDLHEQTNPPDTVSGTQAAPGRPRGQSGGVSQGEGRAGDEV